MKTLVDGGDACLSIPIVIGISATIGMFTPAPDLIAFERVGCAVMPSIVDSHGRNLPDAIRRLDLKSGRQRDGVKLCDESRLVIDLCPAPAVARTG